MEQTQNSWENSLWEFADNYGISQEDIPRDKYELANLEVLFIWNKALTSIPEEVFLLSKLSRLCFFIKSKI